MYVISIFATDHTDAKDVAALIKAGVEHMKADGSIDWKGMPEAVRPSDVAGGQLAIKYSRAWLIVRRAFLELNSPKSLVTLPTVTEAPEGSTVKEATNRAWSKVITPMRDTDGLSWGEISVRVGVPESKIRTCYRATGAKKDVGLRIGKGGRFAYASPELYLEHRKLEGAQIPAELKGRPAVEQLLNATNPATGKVAAPVKAVAKKAPAKKAPKQVKVA